MSTYRIVAFAFCCASLAAQQVWKVSSNLSYGAQFSDLPPAVAAASPGDTIWVYTPVGVGASFAYTSPTIDKPLTIIGFRVGIQPGDNTPTSIGFVGPLTISDIPAGSQVVLTNVVMNVTGVVDPVLVSNCAGSVVIENLNFRCAYAHDPTIRIVDCADVTLRGSECEMGGQPLEIINSSVLISNSWIDYWTGAATYPFFYTTRETIFLQDSDLTISGSIVLAQSQTWGMSLQPSRNAVVLDNSTLRIGPTTLVRGGYISGTPGTGPSHFIPACLLTGTGTNEVIHDPRSPETNYGPVQPTVTWQHEVIHDWVVGDELFHVKVMGPPGGFALLALGDYVPWLQTATPGAAVDGHLALDPLTGYGVSLVPLNPATGHYDWTFLCPGMAENGHAFVLQALTLSPQSTFGWTIPSPLTVGWDKDRVP